MQSSHSKFVLKPAARAQASAHFSANDDWLYRAVGIALAASLSSAFWTAVLAIALPAANMTPNPVALALTSLSIAGVVTASMLALRASN